MHFQLLTGLKLGYQPKVFGYVFFTIMSIVIWIALASYNLKKLIERYKDWKFHGKINMNLQNLQPQGPQAPIKFNNNKNNLPLLNEYEQVLLYTFVIIICLTIYMIRETSYESETFYLESMIRLSLITFYNIIMPILFFIKKPDMRKYIVEYVCNAIGIENPYNNGLEFNLSQMGSLPLFLTSTIFNQENQNNENK